MDYLRNQAQISVGGICLLDLRASGHFSKVIREGLAAATNHLIKLFQRRHTEDFCGERIGVDQRLEFIHGYSLAKQEPLDNLDTLLTQEFILFRGFNTLSAQAQVQAPGHRNDRNDESGVVLVYLHIADKTLVDFQLIEWKAIQVVQRGITGTEIIDRKGYTELFEFMERINGGIRIIHDHAFGEFQLQQLRIKASLLQRLLDTFDKPGMIDPFSSAVTPWRDTIAAPSGLACQRAWTALRLLTRERPLPANRALS